MRISDWSSDVCSSDLGGDAATAAAAWQRQTARRGRGGADELPSADAAPLAMFVHLSPLFDTGLDCRCSLLNSQSDQAARSSAVSGDSPTITGKPFNAALPDKRSSDRSSVRSLMQIGRAHV